MAFLNDEIIAQLKAHADIAQVIQRFLPLRRSGNRWLGVCPFHDDHKPSMNVNPQLGIFKCFACGAGGDVIKFVMDHEKLDFTAAVELVASETGFPLPVREGEPTQDQEARAIVRALNELATTWFETNLEASTEATAYLKARGITAETRKQFRIGWAPEGWDGFTAHATRSGFSPAQLVQAGLAVEKEGGGIYDKFRARLMFPIQNLSGVVVAFGGRILTKDTHAPKYMNSPETVLYVKGDILYGLHHARTSIAKDGEVILVEGYFDLVSLVQAGIKHVVAVSGTALTDQHARILARYAKSAYLVFDGDQAGRKAALRSLEVLLPHSLQPKVLLLEDGPGGSKMDPDSYVQQNGPQAFLDLVRKSSDMLAFLDQLLPGTTPEERAARLTRVRQLIGTIHDPLLREEYLRLASSRFDVDSRLLRAPLAMPKKPRSTSPNSSDIQEADERPPEFDPTTVPAAERRFLNLVLRNSTLWQAIHTLFDPRLFESSLVAECMDAALGQFEDSCTISLMSLHGELNTMGRQLLESLPEETWTANAAQREFAESLVSLLSWHLEREKRPLRSQVDNNEIFRKLKDLEALQKPLLELKTSIQYEELSPKQVVERTEELRKSIDSLLSPGSIA